MKLKVIYLCSVLSLLCGNSAFGMDYDENELYENPKKDSNLDPLKEKKISSVPKASTSKKIKESKGAKQRFLKRMKKAAPSHFKSTEGDGVRYNEEKN